jgi:cobalt-zinc-cadmium resistance protein CzcA
LSDSIFQLYQALEPTIDLRYKVGEIGLLDKQLFKSELLRFQQEARALNRLAEQAENTLRVLAYLPETATLNPLPLSAQIIDNQQFEADKSLYLKTFQLKKNTLERQLAVAEKQAKLPALNLGYFHQSLEKDFGFQGLTVGVGIPLDKRQYKVQKEQFALQSAQFENEQKAIELQYEQRLIFLQKNAGALRQSMEEYEKEIRPTLLEIQRIAALQFEQGEIDFLAFTQIQEKLLQGRKLYLQQLKNYNENVLELQYRTQK